MGQVERRIEWQLLCVCLSLPLSLFASQLTNKKSSEVSSRCERVISSIGSSDMLSRWFNAIAVVVSVLGAALSCR